MKKLLNMRGLRRLKRKLLRQPPPQHIPEEAAKRHVFRHLRLSGFLNELEGKRILEIGPKHGQDSILLAGLNPEELVLLDLPEQRYMNQEWLPQVPGNVSYVEGNLLYLKEDELKAMGKFDLVWCLGVLYHNQEQLRLLKRLFDLCLVDGKVVIESATTRNKALEKLNVVEIYWPNAYRDVPTLIHLPSRLAIKSWLEMVGFCDVTIQDVYAKKLAWQRAVVTGIRPDKPEPYVYFKSELNPPYIVGDAN
jgi:tRNA (mo5U34)-methyltransferase